MCRHCDRPYPDAQRHNRFAYCAPDDYAAGHRDFSASDHARAQRGNRNAHACDL